MIKYLCLIILSMLVLACDTPPKYYSSKSAEDFVIDSHKIRQGKFSILELEGYQIGDLPNNAMDEYEEKIAESDILNIAIYHPSRKDLVAAVKSINTEIGYRITNGQVLLPDLDPIYIEGLTIEQARKKLEGMYNKEIKDIEVFISYRDRLIRKVELAGMVACPQVPVDGRLRLYELLSIAKIPPNANLFKSYVMRENQMLPVDLTKLVKKGDMSQNIVMRGNDKIFIAAPEEATVMLMGEIGRPQALSVPNGYISLREAIVKAGGIPYTGDKNYIQVIRGSITNPKIYRLRWNHIVHLPNQSLLLIPGDVVYISPKPITEWNRFINQLLPSLGGLTTSYGAYKVFQR